MLFSKITVSRLKYSISDSSLASSIPKIYSLAVKDSLSDKMSNFSIDINEEMASYCVFNSIRSRLGVEIWLDKDAIEYNLRWVFIVS